MHIHGFVHVDGSTRRQQINVLFAGAIGPKVPSMMSPPRSICLQAAANGGMLGTDGTIGPNGTAGSKGGTMQRVQDGSLPNHRGDFRIFRRIPHQEAGWPKGKEN